MSKVGIGQDSHRIQEPAAGKALVLGGLTLAEAFALEGNSDSDVVLHALTNAVSGITGKPILGPVADGRLSHPSLPRRWNSRRRRASHRAHAGRGGTSSCRGQS